MADFNMESMGLTFRVKEVYYKAIDGKSGTIDSEFISNDQDYHNIDDAINDYKTRIGINSDIQYEVYRNFDEARDHYAENHPSGNKAKAYVSLEYFYNSTPEFSEQLKQLNSQPFDGVFTDTHGIVPSQSFRFPLTPLIGPNGIMIEKDSDPRIMAACQKINQEIMQYGPVQTWQDIQDQSKGKMPPENDVQQQIGQTVQNTLDQNVQQDISEVVASALDQDVQSEIGQVVQSALDQNEPVPQQAQPVQQPSQKPAQQTQPGQQPTPNAQSVQQPTQQSVQATQGQQAKQAESYRIYFDRNSVKIGRDNNNALMYEVPIRVKNYKNDYLYPLKDSIIEDPKVANECGPGWCFFRVPADKPVDYIHKSEDGKVEVKNIDPRFLGLRMQPYVEIRFPVRYIKTDDKDTYHSQYNNDKKPTKMVSVPKLEPNGYKFWENISVKVEQLHTDGTGEAYVRYSPDQKITVEQADKLPDGKVVTIYKKQLSPKELKAIYDTYKCILEFEMEQKKSGQSNQTMADDEKKPVSNVHDRVSDKQKTIMSDNQKTIPKPEQSASVKVEPR